MDESKGQFKAPGLPLPRSKRPDKPPSTSSSSEEEDQQSVSNTPSPTPPSTPAENANETPLDELSRQQKDDTESEKETKSLSEKNVSAQSYTPLPYTVPHWSATPTEPFFMSVIKNGTVVDEVSLTQKPYIVFGRLPCCDVQLEHPSLSRYHAVLQYRPHIETDAETEQSRSQVLAGNPRESGYYVYDLGSTHGTYINKTQINARCYYRLRVGQMVRFGGSSRMFLLESGTGNQEDVETSAQEEIQEILERNEEMEKKRAEAEALREQQAKERENMGAMWGMLMDDVPEGVEEDIEIDPQREAYYIDDPKKALRKFFDREGLEFEYETVEEGPPRARVFAAKIRLPIDTATGESVYAEASVQGKKKEAVMQCALNACRILDSHDMLRESSQRHKRKKRNWEENDYYDSDEDTFLDRTGTIEVKRKQRMKKAGVEGDSVETYQSLQKQMRSIQKETSQIEQKLEKNQQVCEGRGEDDLDLFMKNVSHQLDPSQKRELKQKLHSLKKEEERVSKLLSIAKPAEMPTRTPSSSTLKSPSQSDESPKVATPTREKSEPKKAQQVKPQSQDKRCEMPDAVQTEKVVGGADMEGSKVVDTVKNQKQGPSEAKRKKVEEMRRSSTDQEQQWQKDEDYSDWLPPDHQSGDGRTHLNDKYGY